MARYRTAPIAPTSSAAESEDYWVRGHTSGTPARRRDRFLWTVATAFIILANCAWPSCGTTTTHLVRSSPTAVPPTARILVGSNIDVSQAPGAQDEVSAAIDPANPSILLAGSNSLRDNPATRLYGSSDAGSHWSSALLSVTPSAKTAHIVDQWVAIGPDHRQAIAYLAFEQTPQPGQIGGVALYVATRSGPSVPWLIPSSPVNSLLQLTDFDDKPTLLADNGAASPYRGRLYAAWTRWIGGIYGEIFVSFSADWGHTWSPPVVKAQPQVNTGAALAITPDGGVVLAWVGFNNLWIARSGDGGATFSPPIALGTGPCLAPMVSCARGNGIPAQTDAGVWANPSLAAIPAARDQPAEIVAVYANGDGAYTHIELARVGAATLRPLGPTRVVPIGSSQTDQFLPAAAYDPVSRALWVCAYTSVGPEQQEEEAQYTCTASLDGGVSFLPAVAVASVASDEEQPGATRGFFGSQYGDYTDVVAAAGVAHTFWTDSRMLTSLSEEIYTATLRLSTGADGTG